MAADVTIPQLGESITEGVLARWLKADGASVEVDEPVAELETEKATVDLPAPAAGVLRIRVQEGATVKIGDTIARIEETARAAAAKPAAKQPNAGGTPEQPAAGPSTPEPPAISPAARKLVEEHGLDPAAIRGTGRGGRLTKEDVLGHLASRTAATAAGEPTAGDPEQARDQETPSTAADGDERMRPSQPSSEPSRDRPTPARQAEDLEDSRRVAMSAIRRRIAERLVRAQHTAAILTTFNEIDMSAVMALRAKYKAEFQETHGVSLGFMSFFARACVHSLHDIPAINAEIDGDDLVYHRRVHLGFAASTDRGLVVPIVRNADRLSFAELEREIGRLAELARAGKLSIEDLSGGTFTISNGGVFGSLMSTPILNPPQSGILGMHKIERRPVVIDDEIVIRPMMYVALSYDHRIVDGREAVTFLVRVKQRVEDPERLLLDL